MRYVYCWLLAAVLLAISKEAYAQIRDKQVIAQVDSVLTDRYYKTPYDTNYVVRPDGRLTLKVRLNQSGDDFHVKGEPEQMACPRLYRPKIVVFCNNTPPSHQNLSER